jgi:hypothetical protein
VTDVDSGAVDVLTLLGLHVCSGMGVGGFRVDGREGRPQGGFAEDRVGFAHHLDDCFIQNNRQSRRTSHDSKKDNEEKGEGDIQGSILTVGDHLSFLTTLLPFRT